MTSSCIKSESRKVDSKEAKLTRWVLSQELWVMVRPCKGAGMALGEAVQVQLALKT